MSKPSILVTGDSFCANWSQDSWQYALSKKYNITGQGFGGQSWWHARRWLYNNLPADPSDTTLIFFHTNPGRIPAVRDIPVTPWVVNPANPTKGKDELNNLRDPGGKILNVAQQYFQSDLFVFEFWVWAQEQFILDLARTTADFKKVIHFFTVGHNSQQTLDNCTTGKGVLCNSLLSEWSMAEVNKTVFGGLDHRPNHFSIHNNQAFAEYIEFLLEQPIGTVSQINNTDRWKLANPSLIKTPN